MEKLMKTRAACRGWATRESTQLAKLLFSGDTPPKQETLKLPIAEFDKRLATLDEIQAKIEEAIDDVTQLEDNIGEAYDFRSKILLTKIEAVNKLAELTQANLTINNDDGSAVGPSFANSNNNSASSGIGLMAADQESNGQFKPQARLPKLEIAKFSGEITEWQTFWDKFEAIVDKSNIPTINKFTYLTSLLQGDASEAIRGLALTEANYSIARSCLEDRFGRKDRIIFTHIQSLLNMTAPNTSKVATLWKVRDELNVHVRSLESLGVDGKQYGIFLTPLILSRLPQEIRMEWARTGERKESDLDWLLSFLKKEIERRERSDGFKDTQPTRKLEEKPIHTPPKRSVKSAMPTSSTQEDRTSCVFCSKSGHASVDCWEAKKMTVNDRHTKVVEAKACFRCLARNHFAKSCMAKCNKCHGRHHELLCKPKGTTKVNHVGVSYSNETKVHAVLQTARVLIKGSKGSTYATVLFDTGSDNTYVTSSLVKTIRPEWVTAKSLSYAAFGGGKPSPSSVHNVYNLILENKMGGQEPISAVEVKTIYAPRYRTGIPKEILQSISHLQLADRYDENREIKVDILVGLDHYWEFMRQEVVRLPGGLVVQDTVSGWILSGLWKETSESRTPTFNCNVTHQLFCQTDMPGTTIKSFWDLETIGVSPALEMDPDDKVLTNFNKSIEFVNGRYKLKLPWKEGMQHCLHDNRNMAEIRLKGLCRRLARDPPLEKRYDEALNEMERLAIIKEVLPCDMKPTDRPTYYMPHHPVIKESSLTTKVRPVFDASAKCVNNISLNDCLETGPSLIPDLVEILIRFRRWNVGLTADITKAFLQIGVHENDQDVHRFLWPIHGSVRVMKFTRVPFGNTVAPFFLLNATLKHHLSQYPDSQVVKELRENIYVDDWLSGADDEIAAGRLFHEANQIMSEGSFPFSSWNSNDPTVTEMLFCEFGAKQLVKDSVKILGLKWMKSCDSFSFGGLQTPTELIATKRIVLSLLARLYDPLGFLTPFTMYAKILLQDIWVLNAQWDDEVPHALQLKFKNWSSGLDRIQKWTIPRRYMSQPWTDLKGLELHCFGDASEKGYGSVVYLRIPLGDGTFKVSFVTSRARVDPIKKISLPRLELLGALLTARLLVFVRSALKLPSVVYRCWTDSAVTLGWIKGQPSRWKTFVANRVSEIQQLTSTLFWSHCPGKGNPADLLTRGVLAEELVSSAEWLAGPYWLRKPFDIPVNEIVPTKEMEQFLGPELKSVMPVTAEWSPLIRFC